MDQKRRSIPDGRFTPSAGTSRSRKVRTKFSRQRNDAVGSGERVLRGKPPRSQRRRQPPPPSSISPSSKPPSSTSPTRPASDSDTPLTSEGDTLPSRRNRAVTAGSSTSGRSAWNRPGRRWISSMTTRRGERGERLLRVGEATQVRIAFEVEERGDRLVPQRSDGRASSCRTAAARAERRPDEPGRTPRCGGPRRGGRESWRIHFQRKSSSRQPIFTLNATGVARATYRLVAARHRLRAPGVPEDPARPSRGTRQDL